MVVMVEEEEGGGGGGGGGGDEREARENKGEKNNNNNNNNKSQSNTTKRSHTYIHNTKILTVIRSSASPSDEESSLRTDVDQDVRRDHVFFQDEENVH